MLLQKIENVIVMKFPFILNKSYHEWPEPFISEAELRKVGQIDDQVDLFLKEEGVDHKISSSHPVDLARVGVEQIYALPREKFQFIINGKLFVSPDPFVTESEIRVVGRVPANETIFFKIEGPDRKVNSTDKIDLKPYPIEEFYSVPPQQVKIKIDNNSYPLKPGKHTVAELKSLAGVSPAFDLDQLIDNQLHPLPDDGTVIIRGGEEFKSRPKDGSSS